jgi:hypothetical protein
MSIINVEYLRKELNDDATNDNNLLEKAVKRGSNFVNSYTAKKYYPFDNYDVVNDEVKAPDLIISICVEVAKVYYNLSLSMTNREGEEIVFWQSMLKNLQKQLTDINISPDWIIETISLDTENRMILGSSLMTNNNFQVVPYHASIINGTENFILNDDFSIINIGNLWYLQSLNNSSLNGNIHYMRTYKNTGEDYALYSSIVKV